MLTSGGDCQGLNSAMRGVSKTLFEYDGDTKIFGFQDGYYGLMHSRYREMYENDFSGILARGGTILGTSRQPFSLINDLLCEGQNTGKTKLEAMVRTYRDLALDALVILGGNGSHKTANLLYENGLNIVTLPKTIDNDLWATEMTFGFQTAVNIATQVIDGIHTTATSHGRVFIVEVMGHKVGWLTLYAGIAGGADVILIPEIPYELQAVVNALGRRRKKQRRFSIIAMAEGSMTSDEAKMTKEAYDEMKNRQKHTSAAYELAERLSTATSQEVRCTVPGHFQRGGSPSPYDRILTTRLGVAAASYIIEGTFGVMAGVVNGKIVPVPLSDVAGRLKYVPTDHELIRAARKTGISFGDEI